MEKPIKKRKKSSVMLIKEQRTAYICLIPAIIGLVFIAN